MKAWWYVGQDGKRYAVDDASIRSLLVTRQISADTLVWTEGMGTWTRAEIALRAGGPPPLPEERTLPAFADTAPQELAGPERRPVTAVAVPAEHRAAQPRTNAVASFQPAGPWRRWVARMLDMLLLGLPCTFAVAFLLGAIHEGFWEWLAKPGSDYVLGWLLTPVVLIAEAVIYSTFGGTPGKGLMGCTCARSMAPSRVHRSMAKDLFAWPTWACGPACHCCR